MTEISEWIIKKLIRKIEDLTRVLEKLTDVVIENNEKKGKKTD